jgi:hypothetical protein
MDFKIACYSNKNELLYSILTEFGIPIKEVTLVKINILNRKCIKFLYAKV